MWLNIGVFRLEKFAQTVYCQLFDLIPSDASSKGIDNQGFLKNAEAKYRLNLSSSRNSEFRIPNSELNR